MLIDASDYTYNAANIAASAVDIQGRIIPTEDVAGQVHPLRRENLAYLCEMISERKAEAYWSVPSANAPLHKSDAKTLGDAIRELYSHNAANQGAQPRGFFPADVTAADFAAAIVSFDNSLLRNTYPGKLLKLSDCAVPSDVPSNLSADYLRKCFYAANEMRFKEYGLYGRGGTMGGTRKIAGYRENVDGDGNVTITQISDSATCPAAFSKNEDRNSGYYVSVGGHSANGYAYYFSDPPPATSPHAAMTHDEIWYEGSSGAIMLSADVPDVYHDTKVMFFNVFVERHGGGQPREYKFVLTPVVFNTSTSADGDVTMTATVNKAFWQSLVLVAFPQASLTLNGSGMYYGIRGINYAYIVELKYPSSLPDAWTWTPT